MNAVPTVLLRVSDGVGRIWIGADSSEPSLTAAVAALRRADDNAAWQLALGQRARKDCRALLSAEAVVARMIESLHAMRSLHHP